MDTPSSRPSTSSSVAPPAAVSDHEWSSDAAGAGAIRRVNSAHGRITHTRVPSLSGVPRGRDLSMSSRGGGSRNPSHSHSRSRDQSPNPFAFNINHLAADHSHIGQHQRSASTSSTSSSASGSSLPYPLIAQQPPPISTAFPHLLNSSSRASSPSSANSFQQSQFNQSPTLPWPTSTSSDPSGSGFGTRPGTSGAGIAAPFGGLDLNGYPSNSFVDLSMNANGLVQGDINNGYMNANGFDNNFNLSGYDPMNFGQTFDPNNLSFDPLTSNFAITNLNSELDPSPSYLSQLQMQLSQQQSQQGHSAPSDIDMDRSTEFINSLDPRSLATSTLSSGFGQAQHPPAAIPGFGGMMPHAGFGERTSASPPMIGSSFGEQNTVTGFGNPNQHQRPSAAGFGTNPGHRQPQNHPQHHTSGSAQGFGSLQREEYPKTTQTSRAMGFGNHPTPNTSPYHLEQEMTTTGLVFGESSASQHQRQPPSFTEARAEVPSPTFSHQRVEGGAEPSPEEVAAARSMGMGGALAGVDQGSMELRREMQMEKMMMKQDLSSASQDQPTLASQWEGRALGPSPSTTPMPHHAHHLTPTSTHSSPEHHSPQFSSSSEHQPTSNQLSESQMLEHLSQMNSARNRSDTITPAAYRMSVSRSNSNDETSSEYDLSDSAAQWGGGLSELACVMGAMGVSTAGLSVSPQQGQWSTLSSPSRHMIMNPDPIEPFFKTVQERNLVRILV